MPQLEVELGIDPRKGDVLSSDELAVRRSARQREVFDEVCRRFNLTPSRLAELPAENLLAHVRDVIGDKLIDAGSLPALARQYAAAGQT